ncbi:MAG: Gfo/Idh/MocA family oxidoreductase [Chloroflexota bacterium]
MKKTLGVCVIGCGAMGKLHARLWDGLPNAQVVAVMDVDETAVSQQLTTLPHAKGYADYKTAISQPSVDVVSVCIPTNLHPEVAIYAAEQGKHVLCEKPIALTLDDADAMIAAAKKAGVKFAVGLMRRYSPITEQLRQWLDEGNLGRPIMALASNVMELRPKRAMHNAHGNGGPVIDMLIHYVDTWKTILDAQPISVVAQGLTLAKDRPEIAQFEQKAVDTASIMIRFDSGDLATFVVSWGVPPGTTLPQQLGDQFYGAKGILQVKYGAEQTVKWLPENANGWQPLFHADTNMYQLEIEAFANCILHDLPILTRGEDGRLGLQVSLAALESIRTGNSVAIT